MINQELINKYKTALDMCNSNDNLRQYKQVIRETLYRLLQPDYMATLDEVVWAECFINRERFHEDGDEDGLMILRDFDEEDWDAFSGVESFMGGIPPRIASKTIGDCEVTVIVANNGIQICLVDDSGNDLWASLDEVDHLNRRFRFAIGSEICSVIEGCLSKQGLIVQLREQLNINFEGGEKNEEAQ